MHGPFEIGGLRWWLRDGASVAASEPLIRRSLDALAAGRLRDEKRDGRRKALFPLRLAGAPGTEGQGPADHLLKQNRYLGLDALRRRWLRGSKARHELVLAEHAAARGVATPIPLAAGEQRAGGRLRGCLLLIEKLEGVADLRQVAHLDLPPRERRELARAFGALARRVLDAGIFQEDFATNNFLVRRGATPELWMVDFERARRRRAIPDGQRAFLLAKLERDLARSARALRGHFLAGFAGERDAARDWWRRVDAALPPLAAHDRDRMTEVCRAGRRFRPLSDGIWRGYARRDVNLERLRNRRDSPAEARPLPGLERVGPFWRLRLDTPSEAEALWSDLNFLAIRRELAPHPLACWTRPREGQLLITAPTGFVPREQPRDEAEARAIAALLRRTAALGELQATPRPPLFLVGPGRGGVVRARWLRPRALVFEGRRSTPAGLAARLASLAGEAAPRSVEEARIR